MLRRKWAGNADDSYAVASMENEIRAAENDALERAAQMLESGAAGFERYGTDTKAMAMRGSAAAIRTLKHKEE